MFISYLDFIFNVKFYLEKKNKNNGLKRGENNRERASKHTHIKTPYGQNKIKKDNNNAGIEYFVYGYCSFFFIEKFSSACVIIEQK